MVEYSNETISQFRTETLNFKEFTWNKFPKFALSIIG